MIHILVVSHGQLAEGLIDSAKMIVGDQPDLSHLSLSRGEGAHEFAEALDAWLASNEGPVLICCDLRGGTPFNVAARAAHADGRIKVWYGINLAVLMEALLKRKDDLGSLITYLNKVVPASVGHAEF